MTPCDPGSSAEYQDSDRCFQRQQSLRTKDLQWEQRLAPIKSWSGDIAAAIAVLLLMCLAFPAAKLFVDILERAL